MSQNSAELLSFEYHWPAHSELCLTTVGHKCRACDELLAPYPLSRHRDIYRQHFFKSLGIPRPLDEKFLDRLAAALAADPERFAPIIQFLTTYKGE